MSSVAVPNRRRAVTLIEALLFISIALGLIVGGIVFYQQASLNARVNAQTRVISAMFVEMRTALQRSNGTGFNGVGGDAGGGIGGGGGGAVDWIMNDYLVAAGAVPAGILDAAPGPNGSLLRNEWGGELGMGWNDGVAEVWLGVNLLSIPVGACARLAVVDATGKGKATDGVVQIQAWDGPNIAAFPTAVEIRLPPVSPSDAAEACRAADPDGDGNVHLNLSARVAI